MEICRGFIEDFVNTDSGFLDYQGDAHLHSTGQGETADHLTSNDVLVARAAGDKTMFRGFTPFHHAAWMGKVQILRVLLEKAPREILRCCQPVHPIHLAIADGHVKCVELILDHAREGTTMSSALYSVTY